MCVCVCESGRGEMERDGEGVLRGSEIGLQSAWVCMHFFPLRVVQGWGIWC